MFEAMWTVVVSDQRGQVISQHEWHQGSLTIGRDQGRNIVLPSKTASRKHCRLDLVNGMPVIVDEGSANGTLVNGARIGSPTRVDESSRIEVGEFRLALQRQEDESERTVLMKPKAFQVPPPAAPARPATPPPQSAPPRPVPPAAPPPPPRPTAPPPPQFNVSFPEAPPPPRPTGPNDLTSQFDRHLQSVRSYREEAQAQTLSKRGRMDAEWGKLIAQARALQQRLSTDRRVLSFTISRDLKEVAIKIADAGERRGHRYFLLSRDHPEGKYPGGETCWLREFGRDDASFDDPVKAMEELMLRVAGSLA